MDFIREPVCRSCGLPFGSYAEAGATRICESCTLNPPAWGQARAALLYNEQAKKLVLPLKHADRAENASVLALHMHRAGAALLARADCLVPVPLHRWRLLHRRYNQAALLAHAVGQRAKRPVVADALRRVQPTASLGGLSAVQRREVLSGAIQVRDARRALVSGKRVLLIDDVLTSGATAQACAQALLDAGAMSIDVLVASRVPDPRRRRMPRSSRHPESEQDLDDADD
jgi:ComF family protein